MSNFNGEKHEKKNVPVPCSLRQILSLALLLLGSTMVAQISQ
mgnify:CR=1 FL=1